MHVRVNTITGATDIDAGINFLRDSGVPVLQGQKGYRGLTVSGDRSSGTVGVLTQWDTPEDLEASESVAGKVRQEALGVIGGQVTVRTLEQLAYDIGTPPPGPGCALRLATLKVDPDRIDEHAAYFQSTVLPDLQQMPGYRGVRLLIDRNTGEGFVGVIFGDRAAAEAQEAAAQERQATAAERGVQLTFGELREVLYGDLS